MMKMTVVWWRAKNQMSSLKSRIRKDGNICGIMSTRWHDTESEARILVHYESSRI